MCPKVPFERCLVHISRMCRIWITQHPKHKSGFELKEIVVKILHMYLDFINQKSYNMETGRYWYTHKIVRRLFIVIKKALPNIFLYLKDDKIPNTTNSLESFFGHLKGNLNVHRGLSFANRKNFLKWYLYYKNQNNK